MPSHRSQGGFTLVELLIVVIILAILAAVAVPRLAGTTEEAREATVRANLAGIRRAIELYHVQHHDRYPDADILAQLTQRTDLAGDPGTEFGPYLLEPWPGNPLNGDKRIRVKTILPPAPEGDEGWIYATSTGEFRCNVAGAGPSGVPHYDL